MTARLKAVDPDQPGLAFIMQGLKRTRLVSIDTIASVSWILMRVISA